MLCDYGKVLALFGECIVVLGIERRARFAISNVLPLFFYREVCSILFTMILLLFLYRKTCSIHFTERISLFFSSRSSLVSFLIDSLQIFESTTSLDHFFQSPLLADPITY
ncbi:hypothetical protein [Oceanobacillus halotolerans]|uniref:hypothetical protein n=1 Tax=Oceanobacillus halotolerans TaxID=2663380 RepID=UPI0013DC17FF|nr:hypothetical protein [Oceanobacillus halotolerans]